MTGKSKILWALLGIAILLFNPAAICACSSTSAALAHPCCPAHPPAHNSSGPRICNCIDRASAAPAVPRLDTYPIAFVVTTEPGIATSADRNHAALAARAAFTRQALFLTFHEIQV